MCFSCALCSIDFRRDCAARCCSDLEGQLTNAEVAQAMGISIKAVESNVTRAMRALRRAWEHALPFA